MNTAVVIAVAVDQRELLDLTLTAIAKQQERPGPVVMIYSSEEALETSYGHLMDKGLEGVWHLNEEQEDPWTVGVRLASARYSAVEAIWFLGSDSIAGSEAFAAYRRAWQAGDPRILIGPYDWLSPGVRVRVDDCSDARIATQDSRWPLFDRYGPSEVLQFGVDTLAYTWNVVWPTETFLTLGRETVYAEPIPMSVVREARAWRLQ